MSYDLTQQLEGVTKGSLIFVYKNLITQTFESDPTAPQERFSVPKCGLLK